MAVTSNVLIGKSRGSVGNATFSTWKGINVLKEKAVSVANPRTPAQVAQRSALSQTVVIARAIVAVISLGFKKLAIKKSAYNAFASEALKEAYDFTTPGEATFLPADLKISKGTMTATPIASVTADRSENAITFNWSIPSLQPGQANSDVPLLAAFNTTKGEWAAVAAAETRSDLSSTVTMPNNWAVDDELIAYLGFASAITGEASDSVNTDLTIVA